MEALSTGRLGMENRQLESELDGQIATIEDLEDPNRVLIIPYSENRKGEPNEEAEENTTEGLAQRFLRTRLGKVAATAACTLALSSIFAAEEASGTRTTPAVGVAKTFTPDKKPNIKLGTSKISIVPECANPPIYAPVEVQLQAFSCLHETIQKSVSATPMVMNPVLNSSAYLKAQDVINCGFSHEACGRSFTFHIPKIYRCYGENIARTPPGQPKSYGTAQQRFSALMVSPPHKAKIVDPIWDEYGVALIRSGKNNYFVTQFGSYSACT